MNRKKEGQPAVQMVSTGSHFVQNRSQFGDEHGSTVPNLFSHTRYHAIINPLMLSAQL